MIRNLGQAFARNLVTFQQTKIPGKLEEKILNKLKAKYEYNLFHAELINTSWKHDKPKGSETHLELIVVTPEFESLKKSKREEFMKDFLKDEIKETEAFTFKLLTPSKWYDSNQRGLKLKEVYDDPPIFTGKTKPIVTGTTN